MNRPQTYRHSSLGMTLLEMMIAVSILTMVLGVFAYTLLATSRDAKRQYAMVQSQFNALQTLDMIRPILMPARFDTITVSAEGRRIEFNDPWSGSSIVSALEFQPLTGELLYAADASEGEWISLVRSPLQDVRFSTSITDSMVEVAVTAPAQIDGTTNLPYAANTSFRVRSFQLALADTGEEEGTDTGSDTGGDTGTDTGSETGGDTGGDTGSDTGSGTGGDTGSETGGDAGSGTDSGNNGNGNGNAGGNGNGNGGIRVGGGKK